MICDCQYRFKIDKKYNKEPELYENETSDDEELTEDDEDSSVE